MQYHQLYSIISIKIIILDFQYNNIVNLMRRIYKLMNKVEYGIHIVMILKVYFQMIY